GAHVLDRGAAATRREARRAALRDAAGTTAAGCDAARRDRPYGEAAPVRRDVPDDLRRRDRRVDGVETGSGLQLGSRRANAFSSPGRHAGAATRTPPSFPRRERSTRATIRPRSPRADASTR